MTRIGTDGRRGKEKGAGRENYGIPRMKKMRRIRREGNRRKRRVTPMERGGKSILSNGFKVGCAFTNLEFRLTD
jgi:hypothetical protein